MALEIKKSFKNLKYLPITIGGFSISTPGVSDDFTTPTGISQRVVDVLNWAIGMSALVAVVMIIFAGYMFITAAGDPEKIEKGRNAITAAVVGLVIVFLARVVISAIIGTF